MINLTNKTNNMELAKEVIRLFNMVRESLGYCEVFEDIEDLLNKNKLTIHSFQDQDGYTHVIFKTHHYDAKEMKEYMHGLYNTIYGTGEMCWVRSQKFNKRMASLPETRIQVEINKTVDISILTIASILMFSKCRTKDIYDKFFIMSILTYWLDSTEL